MRPHYFGGERAIRNLFDPDRDGTAHALGPIAAELRAKYPDIFEQVDRILQNPHRQIPQTYYGSKAR